MFRAFACFCGLLLISAMAGGEERFLYEKAEMGVPFRITFYAKNSGEADASAAAVFVRLEALNAILSDYEEESELSRLSRSSGTGRAIPVSPELWKVLERSQHLASQSDGAFDITVGPLVSLWRRSRRQGALPSAALLAEMRARVGYRDLRLDAVAHTAELLRPEMRLDLGGIAKGYAADEAVAVLARHGHPRALAAASGDLAAGDPPPDAPGWRVEIATLPIAGAPPAETLFLTHAAVSTSGDAYQFVEIDGIRYSHIVDPHTGVGLTDHSLVTVVAPDGLTADGLDTAIDVLGPEKGLLLLNSYPGAVARILRAPQGKVEQTESAGWRDWPRAP